MFASCDRVEKKTLILYQQRAETFLSLLFLSHSFLLTPDASDWLALMRRELCEEIVPLSGSDSRASSGVGVGVGVAALSEVPCSDILHPALDHREGATAVLTSTPKAQHMVDSDHSFHLSDFRFQSSLSVSLFENKPYFVNILGFAVEIS